MRPFCADCGEFMSMEKAGVALVTMDGNNDPYQLWSVDRHACKTCKRSVLFGYGNEPVAHAHEDTFNERVKHEEETGEVHYERTARGGSG